MMISASSSQLEFNWPNLFMGAIRVSSHCFTSTRPFPKVALCLWISCSFHWSSVLTLRSSVSKLSCSQFSFSCDARCTLSLSWLVQPWFLFYFFRPSHLFLNHPFIHFESVWELHKNAWLFFTQTLFLTSLHPRSFVRESWWLDFNKRILCRCWVEEPTLKYNLVVKTAW